MPLSLQRVFVIISCKYKDIFTNELKESSFIFLNIFLLLVTSQNAEYIFDARKFTPQNAEYLSDGQKFTSQNAECSSDGRKSTPQNAEYSSDGRKSTPQNAEYSSDGRIITPQNAVYSSDGRKIHSTKCKVHSVAYAENFAK